MKEEGEKSFQVRLNIFFTFVRDNSVEAEAYDLIQSVEGSVMNHDSIVMEDDERSTFSNPRSRQGSSVSEKLDKSEGHISSEWRRKFEENKSGKSSPKQLIHSNSCKLKSDPKQLSDILMDLKSNKNKSPLILDIHQHELQETYRQQQNL